MRRPSDEEVSVTRLIPDYDSIPWAYDLAESYLESVRSNGNSFAGITGIYHGEKRRTMKIHAASRGRRASHTCIKVFAVRSRVS